MVKHPAIGQRVVCYFYDNLKGSQKKFGNIRSFDYKENFIQVTFNDGCFDTFHPKQIFSVKKKTYARMWKINPGGSAMITEKCKLTNIGDSEIFLGENKL